MKRAPGHANIEEHPKGSGRFRVRVRVGKSLKVIVSGVPRAEADEVATAQVVIRNADVLREGITLGQFGLAALNRREKRGVRGIDQERNRWASYVDRMTLGKLPITTLRRRDIVDWVDELGEKGLADQTRRNALNLVRAVLAEAVDRELLQANPARDVKVRSSGSNEEDLSGVLQPHEQVALLDACPERDRPVVLFALLTGLRLSEQWWLTWDDIKTDHVLVRKSVKGKAPKSGKTRRVPLLEPVRALLATLPRTSEWVFPAPRGGQRHAPNRPAGWHTALALCNFGRRVRWHDLRHTCATSLLAGWWGRVWSLEEVRGFLGHSTVKVTERYARILDSKVATAAAQTRGELMFPTGNMRAGKQPTPLLSSADCKTVIRRFESGPRLQVVLR